MSEPAAPSVLTESASSAKASNATNMMAVECAGCSRPILDRFLLHFLDKTWHSSCVKCQVCRKLLDEKCFFREGKIYCREDFYRYVRRFVCFERLQWLPLFSYA